MTVEELHEILSEVVDVGKGGYDVEVRFRDDGGCYYGAEPLTDEDVKLDDENLVLEF